MSDQRMREHGAKLMMAISATLRIGRAYAIKNQVFVNQLDAVVETVAPVLQQHAEAVLVAHDADLYLNGVRIPVSQASFKFQETVLELFTRLGISGLRFTPGLTSADLGRLFELVLRPDGPGGQPLLQATAALALRGVAPILHASVDPAAQPGAEKAARAAQREEEERIANQIYEPRIEALELGGQRRHAQAVKGARLLLMPTALQSALEVRHAKRVVQPLVEGVSLSEPIVVGLSALGHHDDYTYAHAVNVCSVAVAIGHFLELDRRALTDVGVAALLHDVGKAAVAGDVANDIEAWTPAERAAVERHPHEGAKLLARTTTLNPTTLRCIRAAFEHHATGGGYPALPAGWRPSLLSEIIAAADCFVSLQSRLSQTAPPLSPSEALGIMLGPYASRFDAALLWALVRAVGFYPAGQVVEMDDGAIAVVLSPNAADLARPHVRIVMAWNGARLAAEAQTELRPIPADRFIARAIPRDDYPEGVFEATERRAA